MRLGLIPTNQAVVFIEDVEEDLQQMDESRLAGLGITPRQLRDWALAFRVDGL